jgi:tetratricopeptide (TPR) repeat protein
MVRSRSIMTRPILPIRILFCALISLHACSGVSTGDGDGDDNPGPPAAAQPVTVPEGLTAQQYFDTGIIYLNTERYEDAILFFDAAIEVDPEYHLAYYNRGVATSLNGQYEDASQDFDMAIALAPNDSRYYIGRGVNAIELEAYDDALADFDKAEQLSPFEPYVYHNRGIVYLNLGRYEDAIAEFDRAIELDPGLAFVYQGRGISYRELEEYDLAAADFDKAIELEPDNVTYHFNKAFLLGILEDYEGAAEEYALILEIDPENAPARLSLAEDYFIFGNYKEVTNLLDELPEVYVEPDDKVINAFLHCIALRVRGKDVREWEAELNALVLEDYDLSWSFKLMEDWLPGSGLSLGDQAYITDKIDLIEDNQLRKPSWGGVPKKPRRDELPGVMGVYLKAGR